ncbi:uncharacterized protein [Hyperolius riggenbachi]|uniref:uncharacterized protein n=1 Tax=Hyperolius riggenbachi TaxID=752182 RepID=UPI0035A35228
MEGEIKDLLRLALNDILEKPFKSFKRKLSEYEHPDYNTIGRSDLENKDREEVVDLIISQYTIHDGPEVVVRILQDINERQVSAELLERLAAVLKSNTKRKSTNSDPAAAENIKKRKTDNTAPRDEGRGRMEQSAGTSHMDFMARHPIFSSASSPPTQTRRMNLFIKQIQPTQQVSYNPPPMRGLDNRSQNQRHFDEHGQSVISNNDSYDDIFNDLKAAVCHEMTNIAHRQ